MITTHTPIASIFAAQSIEEARAVYDAISKDGAREDQAARVLAAHKRDNAVSEAAKSLESLAEPMYTRLLSEACNRAEGRYDAACQRADSVYADLMATAHKAYLSVLSRLKREEAIVTPSLIAVSAIDERSRIVIEQAGGKVGQASTGDDEDSLATLLVKLPEHATIAARINDDAAISIDWQGQAYHIHLRRSGLGIADTEITWGWLDMAEEESCG